jgi:hypothetical protein
MNNVNKLEEKLIHEFWIVVEPETAIAPYNVLNISVENLDKDFDLKAPYLYKYNNKTYETYESYVHEQIFVKVVDHFWDEDLCVKIQKYILEHAI